MLSPIVQVPPVAAHVRRSPRVGAGDPGLASERRHVMLVVAHRLVRAGLRPEWLRWLEQRPAPGQKVF